ncbi:hypothetical protein JCM3774_004141 [Rhodotorula dairenensis]
MACSPPSPGLPIRPRVPSNPHPHPHPHPHPQSQVDLETLEQELVQFRLVCRRLYYDHDPLASRQVDLTLARLPAAFRTAYARAMADVRAEFHRDQHVRQRRLVDDALAEVTPASVVKAHLSSSWLAEAVDARMRSPPARSIRADRLRAFLAAHCSEAMPGPHPFLRGLYALLWLQAQSRVAGARCAEWTVDVAVFTEAGTGQAWTRDAVELLKGVLGMSDRIQPETASTYADSTRTSRLSSALLSSEDLSSPPIPNGSAYETCTVPVARGILVRDHNNNNTGRERAPSDPFLDDKAASPGSAMHATGSETATLSLPSPSSKPFNSPLAFGHDSDLPSPTVSTPFLPTRTPTDCVGPSSLDPPDSLSHLPRSDARPRPPPARALPNSSVPPPPPPPPPPPQIRVFTLPPYLTNPELHALLRLFPPFIAAPVRRTVSRASLRSSALPNWEEKLSAAVHGQVRLALAAAADDVADGGTVTRRTPGWQGTLWERFVLWLQRMFGLAA